MSDLVLVEDYHEALPLKGRVAVAMSPMGAWRLELAGVPYGIPEDYGAWDGMVGGVEFSRWFLDGFLPFLSERTGLDVGVFRLLMTPLRFITEMLFRRAYQARLVLEKEVPGRVHYSLLDKKYRAPIDDDLYRKGGSLFHSVFRGFRPDMETTWVPTPFRTDRGLPRVNWRELGRGPYDWLRTLSFFPGRGRGSLCFANVIPDKMREAKLAGWRVALLPRLSVTDDDWRIEIDPFSYSFLSIPTRVIRELAQSSGLPLTVCGSVEDQLTRYFASFLPKVLVLRGKYKKYLSSRDFCYIIFNRRNKPHVYAAHMAARELGLKTVYVRHGWSADESWERIPTRLECFDYFLAPTEEDSTHYRGLCEREGLRCRVL